MTFRSIPEEEISRFIHWAHEAGRLGLMMCSSGNLSHRLDDGSMLISATGSWLGSLNADQISHIRIDDGTILNGVRPSGEIAMHRTIMEQRPDIDTILHFQSPAATTLACLPEETNYNVIIEVPVYIGAVGRVPFIMPCSQMLADAVGHEIKRCSLVQMQNHGQVVCGKGYESTVQKAVFFELASTIILKSGKRAFIIPEEGVEQLKQYNASDHSC